MEIDKREIVDKKNESMEYNKSSLNKEIINFSKKEDELNYKRKILDFLKWFWCLIKKSSMEIESKFRRHKELINSALALALVILTIFLIISTKESINATKAATNATESIRKVELRLFYLHQKEEIRERINLASNLLIETQRNKGILEFISSDFIDEDNPSGVYDHRLSTVQIEQAIEMSEFGTERIHAQLEWIFSDIKLINTDLDVIIKAVSDNDNKVRVERIGSARNEAKQALDGQGGVWAYNKFEEEISSYIERQKKLLRDVDTELLKELNE